MSDTCSTNERSHGFLVTEGGPEQFVRTAEALARAAMDHGDRPRVVSPEEAETIVQEALRGLCHAYAVTAGGEVYRIIGRLVDRCLIGAALERASGCQTEAARILGINRNTLRAKMKDLAIASEGR